MREQSFYSYYAAMDRINSIIGNTEAPIPNTVENISRDRLLRVQKGLLHLLTEVIPQIKDEEQRTEIHNWVFSIHTITRCEESSVNQEVNHE